MILWDKDGARGWFLGTICSTTKRPGFNFCVKYEKAETNSIEVEGIKATMLDLQGHNAYGRSWVLLVGDNEQRGDARHEELGEILEDT
jgi:hypothetical protein